MTLVDNTVTLRLIKVVLSTGQIEVLATSLIDAQAYPAPAFVELYHARWRIEEAFKVFKHRLYLEQFTAELPESVFFKIVVAKIMLLSSSFPVSPYRG